MPLYPDYIPAKIADRSLWYTNFSTLLTATPVAYGLIAGDAVAVAAAVAAFDAAYAVSSVPATRTSPAIAQTQAKDADAQAIIRPYAVRISKNPSVSALLKAGIGVTIPSTVPTPIPPPSTQPGLNLISAIPLVMTLGYYDLSTPTVKAKAAGSIGLEVWIAVGVAPAVDPSAATYYGTFTKSPLRVDFLAGDQGKKATFFCRWVNRSGVAGRAATGPWSAPFTVTVL